MANLMLFGSGIVLISFILTAVVYFIVIDMEITTRVTDYVFFWTLIIETIATSTFFSILLYVNYSYVKRPYS